MQEVVTAEPELDCLTEIYCFEPDQWLGGTLHLGRTWGYLLENKQVLYYMFYRNL